MLTGDAIKRHGRRAHVERERAEAQQRIDRLVTALADGAMPADEIRPRLVAPTGFEPVFSPLAHVLHCRHERTATCSTANDASSARGRASDRPRLDSSAGELLRADADEAELAVPGILAVVEEGQE